MPRNNGGGRVLPAPAKKKNASAKKASKKNAKKKKGFEFKAKATLHKRVTVAANKLLSDAFWINSIREHADISLLRDVDPFSFVITIEKIPALSVKAINVNGVLAKREDYKVTAEKITCTVKAFVSTADFLLAIAAEAEPNSGTTFNVTCDNKKVFATDQDLDFNHTGKGAYTNENVPLP